MEVLLDIHRDKCTAELSIKQIIPLSLHVPYT
jgi:hypothetical protein